MIWCQITGDSTRFYILLPLLGKFADHCFRGEEQGRLGGEMGSYGTVLAGGMWRGVRL